MTFEARFEFYAITESWDNRGTKFTIYNSHASIDLRAWKTGVNNTENGIETAAMFDI